MAVSPRCISIQSTRRVRIGFRLDAEVGLGGVMGGPKLPGEGRIIGEVEDLMGII